MLFSLKENQNFLFRLKRKSDWLQNHIIFLYQHAFLDLTTPFYIAWRLEKVFSIEIGLVPSMKSRHAYYFFSWKSWHYTNFKAWAGLKWKIRKFNFVWLEWILKIAWLLVSAKILCFENSMQQFSFHGKTI